MQDMIRAMHLLSAIIMVTTGVYVQMLFGGILSTSLEILSCSTLIVYFLMHHDLWLRLRPTSQSRG